MLHHSAGLTLAQSLEVFVKIPYKHLDICQGILSHHMTSDCVSPASVPKSLTGKTTPDDHAVLSIHVSIGIHFLDSVTAP